MSTIKEFISIYNKIINDSSPLEFENGEDPVDKSFLNKYFVKETLSRTIVNFLNSMSEDSKQLLSLNIISKFAENKSLEKIKKARAIFIIYSRKKISTNLSIKRVSLIKWKNFKRNLNFSNSIALTKFEPSYLKKEREELEMCTFKPEINRKFIQNNNTKKIPAYQRLYIDHEKLNNKKNILKKNLESREYKNLSFSPEINITSTPNKLNFYERQEEFKRSTAKRRQEIRKDIEEEFQYRYTFSPKTLKRSSKSLNRLSTNGDVYSPRSKFLSFSKFNDSYLSNSLSNTTRKKFNEKSSVITSKSKVDYKKLEELYNDHKKNNLKKIQLKEELNKEQGVTFKPDIYKNDKYMPKTKFLERNKKLLDDRKQFCDIYQQICEENLLSVGKKCSREEYDKINKSMIERLYSKEVGKLIHRNSIEDVSSKEKLNFEKFMRSQNPKQNIVEIKSPSNNKLISNCTKSIECEEKLDVPQENSILKEKMSFGNYTFGKEKQLMESEKSYKNGNNSDFNNLNKISNNIENKESIDSDYKNEHRLKSISYENSHNIFLGKNKKIMLDPINSDFYESNTNFYKKNSLHSEKNEEILNPNYDITSFRSDSLKNYVERKYSGKNII